MRRLRIVLQIAVLSLVSAEAFASQFVVFPKATELMSPDGRFCRAQCRQSGLRVRY
jgi:hypothetical protein